MTFSARYPGRCEACGERFEVDDRVKFAEGDATIGVVHEDCEAVLPDLAPAPVCPHCWLEKPCGCDD